MIRVRAPSSSTPADPDMADGLVDYAQFLETVRRDYDRAEEMYQRFVEADHGRLFRGWS